eukprot:CAMPEP_0179150244 /NCGR_PEP_ID=MMETSP0796-20121207/72852_1 /TAXON_ID=73915 /ORGANISM="Pyrodinium bahamense, Strain pbaha01" /LENGTH=265 /DNA_ID=CAMNT_0020851193 /DNA_START=20 /DNA_END=817 /DNA_ORIENTATION=+
MIHGLLDQIQPDASDEEDDEQPETDFVFRASGAAHAGSEGGDAVDPTSCRAVVVCGPGAATTFALSALPLQPVPWLLALAKEGTARTFPPPPKPPRFFVVSTGRQPVAVALLEGPVPAYLAGAWAEALLAGFGGAAEVLLLDRVFRFAPGGRERPLEPHLCGLWTAAWGAEGPPGLGSLARLPAPNTVEGLGAALLTQCEAERRRCLVALALQDGAHLGEGCVRSFTGLAPLLQELGVLPADWQQPDFRETVRKVIPPMSMSIYA